MNKKLYIILIIAILFIIGNVAAMFYIFRGEDPKQILSQAFENMQELESNRSKIDLTLDMGRESISLSLDGQGDMSDLENPKLRADFIIGDGNDDLEGKIKIIDQDIYFLLSSTPRGFPDGPKNEWVKISEEELRELEGEPGFGEFEMFEELGKEHERLKERIELISEKGLFVLKEELPAEKIKGQKMYHYLMTLNKEVLAETIVELLEITIEELPQEEQAEIEEVLLFSFGFGPEEGMQELEEVFLKYLNKLDDIDIVFLIGQEDLFIHRIKMEQEIDLSLFTSFLEEVINFELEINNLEFNQPFDVDVPEDSVSFSKILSKEREQSQLIADEAMIESYFNQIRSQAEMYYSNNSYSYKEMCNSEEINLLIDAIEEIGEKEINCNDSKDAYCISYPSLTDEKDFCLDSTGRIANLGACVNYSCP